MGDKVSATGRIQSRVYQKRLENGEIITKTAYEVSISRVTLENENNMQKQSIVKTTKLGVLVNYYS